MSAESCIVFYGLRFEIAPGEIEGLETRADPRMVAARKAGLKTYWGNFRAPGDRYSLFVGALLGDMGPEGRAEIALSEADMRTMSDTVRSKLAQAGFHGTPGLHVQWRTDV